MLDRSFSGTGTDKGVLPMPMPLLAAASLLDSNRVSLTRRRLSALLSDSPSDLPESVRTLC